MDAIRAKIQENGCFFAPGFENTIREWYLDQHGPLPASVSLSKDIRFGSHERHRLDVYRSKDGSTKLKPVLLFVHGGGFIGGDKAWTDKVYANLGGFFASNGIIFVAANHRFVPEARYPDGGEDVRLARRWILENIASHGGDREQVIVWGQSSGGAHLATDLYAAGDPSSTLTTSSPPLIGAIFMSCPWWFDHSKPNRMKVLESYYGSSDPSKWGPKSPLGLFKGLSTESPLLDALITPTMLVLTQWEVKEAVDANLMFFEAYRERSRPAGSLASLQIVPGHNHISNLMSIGTSDTSQSTMLLDFVRECQKLAIERRKE